MTRAATDVDALEVDVQEAINQIREALQAEDGTPVDTAVCAVETFVQLALMVMRKTNPSKIRSEARTLEILARINGIPVRSKNDAARVG